MKKLVVVLCVALISAGALFNVGAASAAEPVVVVTPPPGGPIPIPYPNSSLANPTGRSAITGFLRAQVATRGVISVETDVPIP